jgi:hypothetical protein
MSDSAHPEAIRKAIVSELASITAMARGTLAEEFREQATRASFPHANGVPASSPGWRGTRYPGTTPEPMGQPQRGCGPYNAHPAPTAGTAWRFDPLANLSQGRPHSIRPTLGWRTVSRWDMDHGIPPLISLPDAMIHVISPVLAGSALRRLGHHFLSPTAFQPRAQGGAPPRYLGLS